MPRKKKEKNLKTLVAIVLDETGSMDIRREETISSVNFYLDGIKKDDPTALVTIAEFSDMGSTEEKVRFLEKNTVVTDTYELTEETYRPRGNTPLFDAIGLTIRAVEKESVDRFLFVIVTDGEENSSREFTREQIVSLISEKEKSEKWTFVYLAAGQDAWRGASFIGISTPGTTYSYSGRKGTTAIASAALQHATTDYLEREATMSAGFFGDDTVVATDDEETFNVNQLWTPQRKARKRKKAVSS